MIGTEPVPAGPERPTESPGVPWLFPDAGDESPGGSVSPADRLWIGLRIRLRLWWTRLRFRLWWLHALHVRLVQARLRLRLILLQFRQRHRLRR